MKLSLRPRAAVAALIPALVLASAVAAPAANAASATLSNASAAATASAAAPSAGTLVYIQRSNVWVSKPNGTARYQVTTDGTAARPYASPSMSDTGMIAVTHAGKIKVLYRSGALRTEMRPQVFAGTGRCPTVVAPSPPLRPRISPDGSKIAFTQVRTIHCWDGFETEALSGVVHTANGRFANAVVIGFDPSWVSNSRFVMSDVKLADLGSGNEGNHWFSASDVFGPSDGISTREMTEPVVSRNGARVAVVVSNRDSLGLFPTVTDPRSGSPAKPRLHSGCVYSSDFSRSDARVPLIDSLSVTNDGSTFVFRDGPDVYAANIDVNNCGASTVARVVANASDPFYSPAAYAAKPPVLLAKAPTVSGAARVGKTVRAKLVGKAAGAKASYQWLRNGRAIKKATKPSLKISTSLKGARLSVRVTVKKAGSLTVLKTSAAKRVR